MDFMSAYKRLEKLCSELYNDRQGITHYIDDMQNCPQGQWRVQGWEADLKQLKHYRWLRNQIVHEPGYSADMCSEQDIQWLDNFYRRIMTQTDPLSLYRKATAPVYGKNTRPPVVNRPAPPRPAATSYRPAPPHRPSDKDENDGCAGTAGVFLLTFGLMALLFIVMVLIFLGIWPW